MRKAFAGQFVSGGELDYKVVVWSCKLGEWTKDYQIDIKGMGYIFCIEFNHAVDKMAVGGKGLIVVFSTNHDLVLGAMLGTYWEAICDFSDLLWPLGTSMVYLGTFSHIFGILSPNFAFGGVLTPLGTQ